MLSVGWAGTRLSEGPRIAGKVEDSIGRMLQSLDQPPEAVGLYRWLAAQPGPATATTAAVALSMSTSEACAALDGLVNAHLCRCDEAGERYRVVNPAPILARWLDTMDGQARGALDRAVTTRADAEAVREQYDNGHRPAFEGSDFVMLPTPAAVVAAIEDLSTSCQEICTVLPKVPDVASIAAATPHDRMLLERGAEVRMIYPSTAHNDPEVMGHLVALAETGARIRLHPHPRTRLLIADRSSVVVSRAPEDDDQTALLITTPGIVTSLVHAFDLLWHGADEIRAQTGAKEMGAVEREVLRLLLEGHKDAGIARRLDLSIRTIRRILTRLSEQSGVHGRFALGVRAAELGWVRATPADPALPSMED